MCSSKTETNPKGNNWKTKTFEERKKNKKIFWQTKAKEYNAHAIKLYRFEQSSSAVKYY